MMIAGLSGRGGDSQRINHVYGVGNQCVDTMVNLARDDEDDSPSVVVGQTSP